MHTQFLGAHRIPKPICWLTKWNESISLVWSSVK